MVPMPYRLILLSLAVMLAACSPSPVAQAPTAAATPTATVSPVERGQYLVTTMACDDCHTPFVLGEHGPEPDMSRRLSGHPADLVLPPPPDLGNGPWVWVGAATNTAFAGPWGISYAANLTPSPSGLGAWTEETFIEAIRTGRHWGTSRPILPPMPWPALSHVVDGDLSAIFAYLQSLPPIDNEVPAAVVAGPPPAIEE
jgi:hypothetical protein